MTPFQLDADAAAELAAAGDWYHANAVLEEWRGVVLRRVLVRGFPFQIVFGTVGDAPGYWRHRVSPM